MYNILYYFSSSLVIITVQCLLSTRTCTISEDNCIDLTWSPWSKCNSTCGLGTMTRKRDICCKNMDERKRCESICQPQQLDKPLKETKQCMVICSALTQIKSGRQRLKKTRQMSQKLRHKRRSFHRMNNIGCELEPMDLFFLIDASGSVGVKNFNKTMLFISNFVHALPVGPSKTHVGLATYATNVTLRFNLNQFTNQRALVHAINHIPYESGGTNTGLALQWVDRYAFLLRNGGRNHVKRVLIVMTDGQSYDMIVTSNAARSLHSHRIIVYCVGIGIGIDVVELSAIASDPNHKIILSSFNDLQRFQNAFTSKECIPKKTTPRPTTPTTTTKRTTRRTTTPTTTTTKRTTTPTTTTTKRTTTKTTTQKTTTTTNRTSTIRRTTIPATTTNIISTTRRTRIPATATKRTTPATRRTTTPTIKKTKSRSTTITTKTSLQINRSTKAINPQTFLFYPNSRQCLSSPCNQGTCIPVGSDFLCLCHPGYIGPMCDIDEDDCQKEPCVYGQCEDKVNGYTCKCSSLFYGKDCDKMTWWAIMMISVGIVTVITMSCCCALCIPSCRRKKDEKKEKRKTKPPTKRPIAWTY